MGKVICIPVLAIKSDGLKLKIKKQRKKEEFFLGR